ncbi:MAG: hypothetical protein IAG13_25315 [Deltaproteobacteria bacterium]|nr:hypothetical protein [Nannocystaceae bacterium]
MLVTGCANAVRNGHDTGPVYRRCMQRIGVEPEDDEWARADQVCRDQARATFSFGSSSPAATVCEETSSGKLVCEHHDED